MASKVSVTSKAHFVPLSLTTYSQGPQLELQFTNAAATDTLDFTLMLQAEVNGSPIVRGAWDWVDLGTAFPAINVYGGTGDANINYTNVNTALATLNAITEAGIWELTRVRVQLWPDDATGRTCYIDDVAIDGVTYGLEPMLLDAAFYQTDTTVNVTVLNGNASSNIAVFAQSTTVGAGGEITLALSETGTGTGVFTGSFNLVGTTPGTGELLVNDTDTVTVKYTGDWAAGSQDTTITATVDDTAPVVAITAPLTAADVKGTVSITTTVTETNAYTHQITIGETASSATVGSAPAYSWDTTLETDGSHTIVATVTDAAGNVGTASVTVTVDNTVPVITLQVATPAVVKPTPTGVSPIIFTATVVDATSGVGTVKINLSSLTPVGGAAVSMLDGGVAPDAVAGDGIYTLSYVNNITGEANYTLPITATDDAGNTATANITLGVWSDTDPPVITGATITYDYNTSARPADTFNISATVTDANTVGVVATCVGAAAFNNATMADGGTNGDVLASDGIYSLTVTVKSVAAGSYPITITATDAKGNVATDTSLTLVVDPGAYGAPITLVEGWNLISLPLIPDEDAIAVVLAGIVDDISNVTSVYYWYNDGASTGWQTYIPGAGGTLTTMEDGKAYFVLMSGADSLTITGRTAPLPPATPPTYDVYAGWNFVGFKSLTDVAHATYLTNLVGSYTILWGYQPVGGYHLVFPGTGNMVVGCGYWLWATESGTIVPSA